VENKCCLVVVFLMLFLNHFAGKHKGPGTSQAHKTVMSTTIPVGSVLEPASNPIPNFESKAGPSLMTQSMYARPPPTTQPRDIPWALGTEDIDPRRPRSLSPLSTSPVSTYMLQEVKLRSRPQPDKVVAAPAKEPEADNELAKAFNRAKRISKKFDGTGSLDVEPQRVDVKQGEVKVMVKDMQDVYKQPGASVDVSKQEVKSKPLDTVSVQQTPTQSFGGEKEQIKPVNKSATLPVNMKASSISSYSNIGASASTVVKPNGQGTPDSSLSFSVDEASAKKLASPREEYRLRRQNRSKTLPVASDLMDKNDNSVNTNNRKSVNLDSVVTSAVSSNVGLKEDTSNTSATKQTVDGSENVPEMAREDSSTSTGSKGGDKLPMNKRNSWAPSSVTQPDWIARAQKKTFDIQQDQTKTKELKFEISKSEDKKESPKSPEKELPAVEMVSVQNITFQASKAVISNSQQNSAEKPGVSVNVARSAFEKPPLNSTTSVIKPVPFTATTTDQKLSISSTSSVSKFSSTGCKPVSATPTPKSPESSSPKPVGSSVRKSSIGSAKPYQSEKPTFSNVKPPVAFSMKPSLSADKPSVSSVKPLVSTVSSSPKLGSPTKSVDKPDSTTNKGPTPLNISPRRASVKSSLEKTETKPVSTQPFNNSTNNRNISTSSGNVNNNKPVTSTPSWQKPNTGLVGGGTSDIMRKFGGSLKKSPEVKIEIIDKDNKTAAKEQVLSLTTMSELFSGKCLFAIDIK